MTTLELRGVHAGYGRMEILHDVSLRVDAGEIVSLIGANGAGKTTTLRELHGDGLTVLYVEHIMAAVMALSQRLLVMHEGRSLALGDPQKVVHDPRVVEAYLGEERTA